jgi:hypothetical protein
MTNYIRKQGTIAPKSKTSYVLRFQYQGSRQYLYGAAPNEIVEERHWFRNDRDAYLWGCESDTRHGTAVGWEFLGFKRA